MLPLGAGFASLVWTLPVRLAAETVRVASHPHACVLAVTVLQVLLSAQEFVTRINEAFRASHEGAAVLPPLVLGVEGKAAAVPLQLMQACRM